ncbi:hypothetical protein ACU686_35280 [Yinghuangia aomiensis]
MRERPRFRTVRALVRGRHRQIAFHGVAADRDHPSVEAERTELRTEAHHTDTRTSVSARRPAPATATHRQSAYTRAANSFSFGGFTNSGPANPARNCAGVAAHTRRPRNSAGTPGSHISGTSSSAIPSSPATASANNGPAYTCAATPRSSGGTRQPDNRSARMPRRNAAPTSCRSVSVLRGARTRTDMAPE